MIRDTIKYIKWGISCISRLCRTGSWTERRIGGQIWIWQTNKTGDNQVDVPIIETQCLISRRNSTGCFQDWCRILNVHVNDFTVENICVSNLSVASVCSHNPGRLTGVPADPIWLPPFASADRNSNGGDHQIGRWHERRRVTTKTLWLHLWICFQNNHSSQQSPKIS